MSNLKVGISALDSSCSFVVSAIAEERVPESSNEAVTKKILTAANVLIVRFPKFLFAL